MLGRTPVTQGLTPVYEIGEGDDYSLKDLPPVRRIEGVVRTKRGLCFAECGPDLCFWEEIRVLFAISSAIISGSRLLYVSTPAYRLRFLIEPLNTLNLKAPGGILWK